MFGDGQLVFPSQLYRSDSATGFHAEKLNLVQLHFEQIHNSFAEVTCSDLGDIYNGKRSPVASTHPCGTQINYTCNPGFNLQGNSTIQCKLNGQFEPTPPRCVVHGT